MRVWIFGGLRYDYIDSRRIVIADNWGQASLLVLEVTGPGSGSVVTNVRCMKLGSVSFHSMSSYFFFLSSSQ